MENQTVDYNPVVLHLRVVMHCITRYKSPSGKRFDYKVMWDFPRLADASLARHFYGRQKQHVVDRVIIYYKRHLFDFLLPLKQPSIKGATYIGEPENRPNETGSSPPIRTPALKRNEFTEN